MLEIKNLTAVLTQNGRELFHNLSFTLTSGDKAAIIGEEGNGKSTLLQLIFDPQLVADHCEYSGEIIHKGIPGYLPQMLPPHLEQVTAADFFAGLDFYDYGDLLFPLGLSPDLFTSSQRLGTFSGGEKVKIQLAKILTASPDFLLLDEPTNDMDLDSLQWLEHFIRRCRLPVLYVSHDETLIEHTANQIIHLEQLRKKTTNRSTVVHTSYSNYLARRGSDFEKQEQVAKKQHSDYEKQMERWQQIHDRVEHQQNTISRKNPSGGRLLKKKMHTVLAQGKRMEREKENFLELPETEDAILTKFSEDISLPKGKTVLDLSLPVLKAGNRTLAAQIHLFVGGGERIGIIGSNGAGKSTLLREIWSRLRERTDIIAAYMPQNYAQQLNYNQSAVEYLTANYTKDEVTFARTCLGSMRFTHEEMTNPIGSLSGGQKAKILFLEMVLRRANVLILDEPTRNFSPLSGPVVRSALAGFNGTIISISHDRKYLQQVCTKVYRLTSTGLCVEEVTSSAN